MDWSKSDEKPTTLAQVVEYPSELELPMCSMVFNTLKFKFAFSTEVPKIMCTGYILNPMARKVLMKTYTIPLKGFGNKCAVTRGKITRL
jgi:hypothetical protein